MNIILNFIWYLTNGQTLNVFGPLAKHCSFTIKSSVENAIYMIATNMFLFVRQFLTFQAWACEVSIVQKILQKANLMIFKLNSFQFCLRLSYSFSYCGHLY